jgi:DNA polymerase I
MELQILDCDYVMLNNKPVIRIFGKTIDGETICVFYEKFLPYFYLYVEKDKIDDIKFELEKNNELNIEVVERYLPIGYQEKPVKLLKIIGKDPGKTPEIREYAKKFGTPYEADILFKYRFMVDNDLKGMGWIDVKGSFRNTNTVKCKALDAESIKPIEILKNAPLKFISIDIEVLTDGNLPKSEKDSIIMIALAFSPDYKGKKNLVLTTKQCKFENTLSFNDEKELLEKFKDVVDNYDPDIITGYNCENFDIPYILQRLRNLKILGDIGRSEKIAFTKKLSYSQRTNICGRVIFDPYFIIRYLSVYDQPYKFKRYDLDTVAREMLGTGKHEMNGIREIISLWNGSKDNLKRLIDYCRKDAELALELLVSQKLIDINKFIEMSKLSGLLLQDLMGGQSARHENALLREFHKRKYLMPCKPTSGDMNKRSTKELKGALVLEPDAGLHKDGCTIVLDFTALYPSLIISHNICPTTLIDKPDNLKHETSPSGSSFVTKDVKEGVFPSIAKYLLDTRAEIRKKMKDEQKPDVRRILDAKQYALKGMAVSLYGYTAFIGGRLFTPDVAAAITSWGRENIEFTKDLIEKNFPVKVVYGDTDSIFVKTKLMDIDAAHELGTEISKFVTGRLTGLQLKLEKVFKTFLIETKKRYAGWSFEKENGKWVDKMEMKGIETVRRDWCSLTSETMLEVLNIILKEGDVKKASKYVRGVIDNLAKGKAPIEKLAIVKGITKPLSAYDGIQPHVELAKKIIQRDSTRGSLVGDRLEYVIIKGNQLLSKRAEDPAYVKEKGLEIDPQYYIYNQVLPPLERIFEVCGTSTTELLEGVKQKSLFDMFNGQKKQLSPEETVLKTFESVVCKDCDWSFRRPTLTGNCPKCSGKLYFSASGSIGKTVDLTKTTN